MSDVATAEPQTRKIDLEKLSATARRTAERFNVPAVQLVVIAGKEVVFAGGFGHRDVANGLGVTEHTLFAHGSTGKSYTALLIGTLVDEGLLSWDTKVRDLVPDFRLSDPIVTAQVSVRDILSHRWGMPRHEFAHLAYPGVDRGEIVRRLRDLPLSKELREQFQYCNFGFLLAGHIASVVTGSTWEEQLRKRVLEPLGMADTLTGSAGIEAVADRAIAYEERDGEVFPIPYRQMDNMSPAGGLYSSAADVVRYLLCHLNGGEVDGTRVISEGSLKATHSVQMALGGPEMAAMAAMGGMPVRVYGYGMGWMIGSYRGRQYVSHGGGIDGFTTEFSLLPEEGIAVAVCGNRGSALPNALAYQVLDLVLGVEDRDWGELVQSQMQQMQAQMKERQEPKKVVATAAPAHELAAYAGRFEHPGYGALEFKVEGDQLAATLGAIKFNTTHRHFETWDLVFPDLGEIKFELNFVTDGSGDVSAATVNFEPTLPAIVFPRGADASASDEAVLNGLAGKYSLGPVTVEVKVEAGPKLVGYQNGVRVDLVPAGKLKYSVPAAPGLILEFVVDGDGRATAISTAQGTLTRSE